MRLYHPNLLAQQTACLLGEKYEGRMQRRFLASMRPDYSTRRLVTRDCPRGGACQRLVVARIGGATIAGLGPQIPCAALNRELPCFSDINRLIFSNQAAPPCAGTRIRDVDGAKVSICAVFDLKDGIVADD